MGRLHILLKRRGELGYLRGRRGVILGIARGLIERVQRIQDGFLRRGVGARPEHLVEQGLVRCARDRGKTHAAAGRRDDVRRLAGRLRVARSRNVARDDFGLLRRDR